MQLTGNTVLVTGGATGIGRDLAESFHWLGNQVIIAGRRPAPLRAVAAANPGMQYLRLDQGDRAGIRRFAVELAARHPDLNIVINNVCAAGSGHLPAGGPETAQAIEAVSPWGPIRLIAALLPTLTARPRAAIVNVTCGLECVPTAAVPAYCATRAALRCYTRLLRLQLRDSGVQVIDVTHRTCSPGSSPMPPADALAARRATTVLSRVGAA
ncbi:SDR family NAD(P)-dependent oxidoreductase [Mycobacterium sp. SM1]|uniref:SDR family NAD(P)-dependent oxidoreductase n=1 Tax=Mycobacterium sp. SM1 TaxID=2816243 RepID=UPI001BCAA183|nr:SDR family NAD(P)-dependent oxidoreductase [Mycobacterium sp. SM1]MBS4730660.1 SDR family NAD(P)-dependent oxidoreductase [Mycobacterium sp. SM1]